MGVGSCQSQQAQCMARLLVRCPDVASLVWVQPSSWERPSSCAWLDGVHLLSHYHLQVAQLAQAGGLLQLLTQAAHADQLQAPDLLADQHQVRLPLLLSFCLSHGLCGAALAGRANPGASLCWEVCAFQLMAALAGRANPENSLCWKLYAFWQMAALAQRAIDEASLCWKLDLFWLMAALAGGSHPEACLCWELYAFWLMAVLISLVAALHAQHRQSSVVCGMPRHFFEQERSLATD